jgi:site-specific recombinase XerD
MHGDELVYGIVYYPKKALSEYFAHVIEEFKAFLSSSIAPSTTSGALSYARQFLFFLEDNGQCDFTQLTCECFKLFVAGMAESHRNSMGTLIWSMRKFQSFLNEISLSMVNADRYLLRPVPNQAKVLPCFTEQEKASILAAVDTETHLGKRDYAILKLAIETGLRGIDIVSLDLERINWRTCEIALIQSKTSEPIHIPLLPDVGNAIADYILHARPQSKSRNVFLRANAPHNELGASGAGKHIITRYLKKAGINHEPWDAKSFHALRRTYGTRLVEAGVPLHSVAQLLGQRSADSANRYISQSEAMLRTCCLEISEYVTGKEELK